MPYGEIHENHMEHRNTLCGYMHVFLSLQQVVPIGTTEIYMINVNVRWHIRNWWRRHIFKFRITVNLEEFLMFHKRLLVFLESQV